MYRTSSLKAALTLAILLFATPALAECLGGSPDGIRQGIEECDGNDLGGLTCQHICADQETPGSPGLRCTNDCTLDESGCQTCGNGIIEGDEFCDGDTLPEGAACPNGGTIRCQFTCLGLDTSQCHVCGNGSLEEGEACDQGDIGDATCPPPYHGGTPLCRNACIGEQGPGCCTGPDCCEFDYDLKLTYADGCFLCGNGSVEGYEECDDGNSAPGDGCSPDCYEECGNGITDLGEQCDDGNQIAGDGCTPACNVEGEYYLGGGNEPSDCNLKWAIAGATPGWSVPCVDGDACDQDGLQNGQCSFDVVYVFNESILAGSTNPCVNTAIAAVTVINPPEFRGPFLDSISQHLDFWSIPFSRDPTTLWLTPAEYLGDITGSASLSVATGAQVDLEVLVLDAIGQIDNDSMTLSCSP